MSEPLTLDRFERFEGTVTKRLDGIEKLLWHGQRLEEIEHRVRQLAERTGNADLATPLPQPLMNH